MIFNFKMLYKAPISSQVFASSIVHHIVKLLKYRPTLFFVTHCSSRSVDYIDPCIPVSPSNFKIIDSLNKITPGKFN